MKVKHTAIIYIIIGLFHILPIQPKAQNKIEFNKLINDLGTFSEDSKPKTCTFKFTNHQAKAIAIAHVQSTCGCAVPQYTKKAIKREKVGKLKLLIIRRADRGSSTEPFSSVFLIKLKKHAYL